MALRDLVGTLGLSIPVDEPIPNRSHSGRLENPEVDGPPSHPAETRSAPFFKLAEEA